MVVVGATVVVGVVVVVTICVVVGAIVVEVDEPSSAATLASKAASLSSV
jgi:hypothetical protein